MASARALSLLLVAILLIPHAGAQTEEEREYISHPGNIPLMSDFSTPQLEPGETGELSFSLTNRYNGSITDIEITIEIYRYANIHESKNLSKVENVPILKKSLNKTISANQNFGNHPQQIIWRNDTDPISIPAGNDSTIHNIGITVSTRESTEQGTYFVMFELKFTYNGHLYNMRSRGHFTDTQWENATTEGTDGDPGNINITNLEVDGIIPDTTFGVKKPWPLWPLYLLGVLTVMFAALAIMSYMYEENTNPKFTRMVHKYQRKLGEDRALILHELGKFKKKK